LGRQTVYNVESLNTGKDNLVVKYSMTNTLTSTWPRMFDVDVRDAHLTEY